MSTKKREYLEAEIQAARAEGYGSESVDYFAELYDEDGLPATHVKD